MTRGTRRREVEEERVETRETGARDRDRRGGLVERANARARAARETSTGGASAAEEARRRRARCGKRWTRGFVRSWRME